MLNSSTNPPTAGANNHTAPSTAAGPSRRTTAPADSDFSVFLSLIAPGAYPPSITRDAVLVRTFLSGDSPTEENSR